MTQEQKELLLKDLCARLPYGVKVKVKHYDDVWKLLAIHTNGTTYVTRDIGDSIETYFEEVKPYLFPLSSMTEEQSLELEMITGDSIGFDAYSLHDFTGYSRISLSKTLEIIQWCYENHFDINGLIPMGLAIDATELNIY